MNRSRLELLPYYARLVAILSQYYKDIGTQLVARLERVLIKAFLVSTLLILKGIRAAVYAEGPTQDREQNQEYTFYWRTCTFYPGDNSIVQLWIMFLNSFSGEVPRVPTRGNFQCTQSALE